MSNEGELFRRARDARQMTVQELSTRSGVSTSTVFDVEKERRHVGRQKLALLAAALELTPEQLDEAGRPDAADTLETILSGPAATYRASTTSPISDALDQLTAAELRVVQCVAEELLRLRVAQQPSSYRRYSSDGSSSYRRSSSKITRWP